ncbi:MAG TPA: hypothetical protein PKD07_16580 [Microthrixaceae bacterium]|nr:hypothetical protein [Microthrixaceae bacterium]
MTGQRVWVRTLDGDVIAVDQIVRYAPEEGTATSHTVLTVHTVHTTSDRRHHLGPFVSAPQALDFARRHFGPVVDPAGLSVEDKQRDASRSDEVSPTADMAKYDPPGAVDLLLSGPVTWRSIGRLQALEDSFAKAREAQREAGLRLDGPEVA